MPEQVVTTTKLGRTVHPVDGLVAKVDHVVHSGRRSGAADDVSMDSAGDGLFVEVHVVQVHLSRGCSDCQCSRGGGSATRCATQGDQGSLGRLGCA